MTLPPKPKTYADLIERYGDPSVFGASQAASAAWEAKWMTLWRADIWLGQNTPLHPLPDHFPMMRVYCNRDLVPVLDQAMRQLDFEGRLGEIVTFDGCWNIRPVRGTEDKPKWSIHSWALAFDLNAALMPLGSTSKWSPEFVSAMELAGLTWGGTFSRSDPMHYQYADC